MKRSLLVGSDRGRGVYRAAATLLLSFVRPKPFIM